MNFNDIEYGDIEVDFKYNEANRFMRQYMIEENCGLINSYHDSTNWQVSENLENQ